MNIKVPHSKVSRSKVNTVLASILAVGAGLLSTGPAPQAVTIGTPSQPSEQFQRPSGEARPVRAAANARVVSQGAILANIGGGGGGYMGALHSGGNPPHIWGMSDACRRMVRHNKMRRAGIGGARI